VQLEQCQLVRYNEKSGTLGKPFDEPKVSAGCCVCLTCTGLHLGGGGGQRGAFAPPPLAKISPPFELVNTA